MALRKRIVIEKEAKKALSDKYKCSMVFIHYALYYKKNSLKAKMIRADALNEYNGVKIGE